MIISHIRSFHQKDNCILLMALFLGCLTGLIKKNLDPCGSFYSRKLKMLPYFVGINSKASGNVSW